MTDGASNTESPRVLWKLNTVRKVSHGIEPSVGSKGDSYDNALAETINGLYKAELIHRRAPWKTKETVEFATRDWVSWFNHHRLLEPIIYIPPAAAETNYHGNSPVRPPRRRHDLNQPASMKARAFRRVHACGVLSSSDKGTWSPTLTRLIATSVLKRLTLLFSKKSSRVSRVYWLMLLTAKIRTKSQSPAT